MWCELFLPHDEPSLLPNSLQIFCLSEEAWQSADQCLVVIPLCPSNIQTYGQWHRRPTFSKCFCLLHRSVVLLPLPLPLPLLRELYLFKKKKKTSLKFSVVVWQLTSNMEATLTKLPAEKKHVVGGGGSRQVPYTPILIILHTSSFKSKDASADTNII